MKFVRIYFKKPHDVAVYCRQCLAAIASCCFLLVAVKPQLNRNALMQYTLCLKKSSHI